MIAQRQQWIALLVLAAAPLALLAAPIVSGTIFMDPDIITPASPSSFDRIAYAGIGTRTMFDRRVNAFVVYTPFLFDADFTDGFEVEIQVNPEFGDAATAFQEAQKYGEAIGQLPTALRVDLKTVWIHRGMQPFGGGNNNLLIHTGQADLYVADGILEETLVHEAAHTSLDAAHANSAGWRAAQAADADFISTYARDFPDREDIAESFLPWLAVAFRSDRIAPSLASAIRNTIPNRLGYFAAQAFNMFPVVAAPLPPGGVLTASTPGSGGVRPGYATVTNAGSAPYGLAVLAVTQNGAIVSEAGVPASPPVTRARIFIDHRTGVPSGGGTIDTNTGIALVQMGSGPATLTFTLRDGQGQAIASGQGTAGAGAHIAKFLHELRDVAPNFVLPANFAAAIRFGSLEIESTQPVSLTALRLTANQRGETLLSTTPIADLAALPPSGLVHFPEFVDGGGYTTTVVLLNTSGALQSGSIAILDGEGNPLTVRGRNSDAASSIVYAIPAHGTFVFETDGSAATVRDGWMQLSPLQGSAPVGAGILAYSPGGLLVTESGIPPAAPTTRARIYVDQSGGHLTGIALANPGSLELHVLAAAFQKDGITPAGSGPETLVLPPGGHRARFADQIVGGLPSGFTGVLELSSAAPFVALTLRAFVNSRNEFLLTTFPTADATRSAPAPLVFPQIVHGGGYATQFIFINASGAATSVGLDLHADDRRPMSLRPIEP